MIGSRSTHDCACGCTILVVQRSFWGASLTLCCIVTATSRCHGTQTSSACVQADPGEVTVADIQSIVRDNALPEWVGQALTDGANSGPPDAAVAPADADDGEVVTSRETPLPLSHQPFAAAGGEEGRTGIGRGVTAPRAATPSPMPPVSELPPPPRGSESAEASTRSQGSWGSGGENVDDETKAVVVRAINGMKAQEGVRFRAHAKVLQERWRAEAEVDVRRLQGIIQQYEVRSAALSAAAMRWHRLRCTQAFLWQRVRCSSRESGAFCAELGCQRGDRSGKPHRTRSSSA